MLHVSRVWDGLVWREPDRAPAHPAVEVALLPLATCHAQRRIRYGCYLPAAWRLCS